MRTHSINAKGRAWASLIGMLAMALGALACGNLPQKPDSAATVSAFYATITAQAASGSPFPTHAVTSEPNQQETPSAAATSFPTQTPSVTPTPPDTRPNTGAFVTIPRCP